VTQLALTLPTAPVAVPAPAGAGPAPLVIGLDVALVLTGVAGPGWTDYVNSKTRRGEERLDYVLHQLQSFYRHADFVVIEGPSFGSALQAGHDEMAAMRWMVRVDLWKRRIPYAVCPPVSRTKFALGTSQPKDPQTGKRLVAKQAKAAVADAVAEQYGIECEGRARYDQADAYVLMAMGRAHLGHPLAALPATHTRALAGITWPERTTS